MNQLVTVSTTNAAARSNLLADARAAYQAAEGAYGDGFDHMLECGRLIVRLQAQ